MDENGKIITAMRMAAQERGGRHMWRNIIADTVMQMLRAGELVTSDALRQTIEGHVVTSKDRYISGQMLGALNVLNGRAPKD